MIPRGLKVGDTFEDGGVTFKVTKVNSDTYESIRVGETPLSAPEVERIEIKEEPKEDGQTVKEALSDYESLPYAQLKKLCAERGLDASGKKSDLIARLEG